MSAQPLRLCPFCGSHDVRIAGVGPDALDYAVECGDCGACGGSAYDAKEAEINWNQRTSDTGLDNEKPATASD